MGKVILVVEDEPKNMKLVCDLLLVSGYNVLEAYDGKQGVNMAIAGKPDLVLMDIVMPIMDGYTATKSIKNNQATKKIPIIVLTAHAMNQEKEKALESGADDYISKPIDIHALLNMINKYLNEKTT